MAKAAPKKKAPAKVKESKPLISAPVAILEPEAPLPAPETPNAKRIALETGLRGPGAILDENGASVSMTAAFGRPALEPGQAPPPFLTPEGPERGGNSSRFDLDWKKVQAEAPQPAETIEEEPEHEPKSSNPFDEDEGEEAVRSELLNLPETEEPPVEAVEAKQEQDEPVVEESPSIMDELADLRKENRRLKQGQAVMENKDGLKLALAKIGELEMSLGTANLLCEQLKKARPNATLSLPKWEGKNLRIAFPCYKTTNPATAMCLVAIALDFGRDSVGFLPALGDARIANSRNRLADLFMRSGAQRCLMVDDDMILPVGRPQFTRDFIGATAQEVPDKVLEVHVVKRLWEANKGLIGATYFGRRKRSPAMFKGGIEDPVAYQKAKACNDEVIPTDWVATGCMMIHRDTFLAIQKNSPELAPSGDRQYWDYFQEGQGQSGGEDVMFCARAKKAGIQPYVDLGAQCFHVGFCAYGFHNTEYEVRRASLGGREENWFR